jgi:hypothetical protein
MTTRRRIVRDLNGLRLFITRQRLVDFEEDGHCAMKLKDFREANAVARFGSVNIKTFHFRGVFPISFGDDPVGGGGYIGCHLFDRKAYARILKAAGVKPKAVTAVAGR